VRGRHVQLDKLGVVVESADAEARADVRPKVQTVVRRRVGVVGQPHPTRVRGARPPGWLRVVRPVERDLAEQHRVARSLRVAVSGHQVGHAGLGRLRLDVALDLAVLAGEVHVALPGLRGEPSVQRRVRSVQHRRVDHLSRPRADLDRAPPAIRPRRRLVLRETEHITGDAQKAGREERRMGWDPLPTSDLSEYGCAQQQETLNARERFKTALKVMGMCALGIGMGFLFIFVRWAAGLEGSMR
jgi:hypothetical protein